MPRRQRPLSRARRRPRTNPRIVLDASALLAWLRDEPGADLVGEALEEEAAIGAVNLAEVLSKLAEYGQDPEGVLNRLKADLLDGLVTVFPLEEDVLAHTARLRPLTKDRGLALGDRACLALATVLRLPVLTADSQWAQLADVDVEVRCIR